jgi:guanylate kinase
MAEHSSTPVVILSAPSGTGKTTLAHRLMARLPQLAFSVSATTRAPRNHEVHGKDYYFLSEAEFRQKIQQGAFVEWEEVYAGRFYGTLRSEVERIAAAGQAALFDVDVKGGRNLKAQFGTEALAVFIRPPSMEALEARLRERGAEDNAEIRRRLERAEYELDQLAYFDEVVVNDNLPQAETDLMDLLRNFLRRNGIL